MPAAIRTKSASGIVKSPRRNGSPQCVGFVMKESSSTSDFASTGVTGRKVAASRQGRKVSLTTTWYGSSPVIVASAVNCRTGVP